VLDFKKILESIVGKTTGSISDEYISTDGNGDGGV
jgi:hypothetical protein